MVFQCSWWEEQRFFKIFDFLTTLNGVLSLFGVMICYLRLRCDNGLVM